MPSAKTLLQLGQKAAEAIGTTLGNLGQGIRAYHGSPHDFERFDLSKIGTGEGAQAYGHGLYFAENPAVARDYREALSGIRGGDPHDLMTTMLQAHKGDYQAAAAELRGRMEAAQQLPPQYRATNSNLPEAIRLLETGAAPKGRMYEVNIHAQPEQFLDWDKPLRDQPTMFQTLRDAGFIGEKAPPYQKTGQAEGRALVQMPRAETRMEDRLREAGIPGIKYLDQGSRGPQTFVARHPQGGTFEYPTEAEAKTFIARNPDYQLEAPKSSSNYVLFRDDIIDILRKYGLAGAAAPAAAKSLSDMSQE